MKINTFYVTLLVILCVACGQSEHKSASAAAESPADTSAGITTAPAAKPAPTPDGELNETGLLKKVEDSGYRMPC